MFGIFGRFRRSKQEVLSSEEQKDDSFGETIPTEEQFFMELPVRKERELEPVQSLLQSLGASIQTDGIRSASSISSLSSNSESTHDLPRRNKALDSKDAPYEIPSSKGTLSPLAWFAPSLFEEEAPPLKNAKHVSTFWQTWLSCCAHDALDAEPTYSVAPTDKSLFGFFESDEEADASNKVAKKKGGFNAWRQRLTKTQEAS